MSDHEGSKIKLHAKICKNLIRVRMVLRVNSLLWICDILQASCDCTGDCSFKCSQCSKAKEGQEERQVPDRQMDGKDITHYQLPLAQFQRSVHHDIHDQFLYLENQ